MKRPIIAVFIFLLTHNLSGQSWQRVQIGPSAHSVGSMIAGVMFNDTTVIISDIGDIIYSTDFFQTFTIDSSFNHNIGFEALAFVDRDTGYISCPYFRGGMLKTINGGKTWDTLATGHLHNLYPGDVLLFTSPDTAYSAFSNSDGLGYTYNNGAYWGSSSLGIDEYVMRFRAYHDTAIYVLGRDALHFGNFGLLDLFRSNDYGNTWQKIDTFGLDAETSYGDFYFVDDTTIIVSAERKIFKSTDGGATFNTVMSSQSILELVDQHMNSIAFISHDTGFVAFAASVFKTYDAGSTWMKTDLIFDSTDRPNEIYFILASSSENVLVGCARGDIYKTTTGGGIWSGINDISEQKSFTIYPNPTNDKLFGTISSTTTKTTLQIITPDGRVVIQNVPIQQTHFEADVSNLATGIYFLVLQDEQERFVKKFIKM